MVFAIYAAAAAIGVLRQSKCFGVTAEEVEGGDEVVRRDEGVVVVVAEYPAAAFAGVLIQAEGILVPS